MADTAISGLTAASTLAGTEVLPVVQSGTKKATFAQVGTYIGSLFGLVKNNTTTTDPGVSNDTTQGYAAGSRWYNSSTGANWICRDASTGAAVWVRQGVATFTGYASGNWYPSVPEGSVANGSALAANSIRYHPFLIREKVTLSDLGARVTTAAASGNIQLAIYRMNMSTRRPTGTALTSTPSISTASATTVNSGAALNGGNVTLEPGWYFFALNVDSTAGGTVSFSYISISSNFQSGVMGSTTQATIAGGQATGSFFLTSSQTYGTWGDVTSATFTEVTSALSFHGHYKVA